MSKTTKQKTYLVAYNVTQSAYYEVDADSEEEAIKLLEEDPYGDEVTIRYDGSEDGEPEDFRVVEEVEVAE